MNHLLREKAPISDAAWAQIDDEATSSLKEFLAARRIVDVTGPKGWAHSVRADRSRRRRRGHRRTSRSTHASARCSRWSNCARPSSCCASELDAIDRGACDADLDPVRFAAKRAAMAEDRAVIHGFAAGAITGITEASPHEPVIIGSDYDSYPSYVAAATSRLKLAGVAGPYALAIGPRCYTGVLEQSEMGGYPVLEHLKLILGGGPVVFAPGVDGALVISQRGGDVDLVLGQDFSIGYLDHSSEAVELYLEESLAVKIAGAEAAVQLAYAD